MRFLLGSFPLGKKSIFMLFYKKEKTQFFLFSIMLVSAIPYAESGSYRRISIPKHLNIYFRNMIPNLQSLFIYCCNIMFKWKQFQMLNWLNTLAGVKNNKSVPKTKQLCYRMLWFHLLDPLKDRLTFVSQDNNYNAWVY